MMWAIPLATAALGAIQGQRKRQDQIDYNNRQAEMSRYSPWTGMQANMQPVNSSMMGGAMQGGMAGMAAAQGMGGAEKAAPVGEMMAGGGDALGGFGQQGMPSNPWDFGKNPNMFQQA